MSHYLVAVFQEKNGKSVEDLLEPYWEELYCPHYKKREELIQDVRNMIEDYRVTMYNKYLENPDKFLSEYKDEERRESLRKYLTEEFPQELEWSDEQCYQRSLLNYCEEDVRPDGSVFLTYNPNSKWDWYEVGGRFENTIPLKNGTFVDEADMNEVNVNGHNEKAYNRAIRFWQLHVDGESALTDEDREIVRFVFYKKSYYTNLFDSAEDYANWVSGFTFYAAVLPTGEWLEPGKMGWFGMSSASAEDEKKWRVAVRDILKKAQEEDWVVTMVDCHI